MIARLVALLRRLPGMAVLNRGGYWGGVIVHGLRRAAAAVADFLRL